ncbi:alpha-ketoglutarate-dependent dioxygenase AlkB family protein [Aquimarina agarivorans]|uniref:alpha-ketoglutarate-dependent dioxygenase AlkB family protein n=1 Tax=Aquimarina agarivorans TaxID=980584 RepID=UPI000248FB15|nr:alpha-ketoglutarate-dependent dioxygenase AlkB [Aquimarina agarivorans]
MQLFQNPHQKIDLALPDADIIFYPNFISPERAQHYYNDLLNNTTWQQDNIKLFGKTYPQPRLTHLFANNNLPYSYSNITMYPTEFTSSLLALKNDVEVITSNKFTTCLANLYRNGQDSNGWHADNEKELGERPIIASISLGASRWFHLKHRTKKELKQKIELTHGSLLLMQGNTQKYWLHQIPKTKKPVGKRINLTFRIVETKN